jgi:hypothetical protein
MKRYRNPLTLLLVLVLHRAALRLHLRRSHSTSRHTPLWPDQNTVPKAFSGNHTLAPML